jgi:DNA-directed RNA polymerase specialized sigma24 family protein
VKSDNGPWMLREAAKAFGVPEDTVDRLFQQRRK